MPWPEDREDQRPPLRRRHRWSFWVFCCCSCVGGWSVAPSRRVLILLVLCTLMHRLCLATCPQGCDCKWKYGKETVDCRSAGFIDVPPTFDPGTQVLDMSMNNLQVLPKDTFVNAGLLNLQRIYLQHCHLKQMDQEAFRRLSNLVELDISHNDMTYVPAAAFAEMTALRRLILSVNPLKRLEDDVFIHLPSLTTLELSRCELERVAENAFRGLEKLTFLKLDGNKLSHLHASSMMPLTALHGMDLHENPWKCDCLLRPARQWMITSNVPVTVMPTCAFPSRLTNVTWDKVLLEEFACETEMSVEESQVTVDEMDNVTLTCRVSGNPEPNVHWVRKGHAIANLSETGGGRQMYVIQEEGLVDKVSNLTITTVMSEDTGIYTCVAENKANRKTRNVTLTVLSKTVSETPFSVVQVGAMVGGGAVGVVALLLLACALVFKYRRRRRERKRALAEHKHHHVCLLNHKEVALLTLDKENLTSLMANKSSSTPRVQYQEIPTVDRYEQVTFANKNSVQRDPCLLKNVASGEEVKLTTVVEEEEVSRGVSEEQENSENEELEEDCDGRPKQRRLSEADSRTSSLPESCASCGQPLPAGRATLDRRKLQEEVEDPQASGMRLKKEGSAVISARTCARTPSPMMMSGEAVVSAGKLAALEGQPDGTRV